MNKTAAVAALVLLAAFASGCTTMPGREALESTTAILPAAREPGVPRDGRAEFRRLFCDIARRDGVAAADDPDCTEWLWRLADEPPAPAQIELASAPGRLRWFIVTGALGDCFGEDSLPFREGIRRLAMQGRSVETVLVSGRSGTQHNARQIAGAIRAAGLAPSARLAVMGYSKGAVDILQLLADEPALAARVAAVVSLSGPITGSSLADRGAWIHDHLLANTFADRCDPGDGGMVDSMRTEVRLRWLADHPPPEHVRYFSLAAFPTWDRMARGLKTGWRLLAAEDVRNDGQVTVGKAMLPGSTLLGYANSDHWGLTLTVENALPYIAGRQDDRQYPQAQLLEAIIRYVEGAVDGPGGSRGASGSPDVSASGGSSGS
ncbi:MAG: hypothetical protein P8080_04030 [Gammaproteobacteria bacterium]